jgi:GT2 family glycosyltransferase
VFGSADLLKRCLFALNNTVPEGGATIYIVDDFTPPDKAEGLDEIRQRLPKNVKWFRSSRNAGFAASNNFAVGKGGSPYVCLLNSDTEPQRGWFENMVSVLDSNPTVGIVGAKLVFPPWIKDDPFRPPNRIQHAGVVFNCVKQPYHIFVGWDPEHPKVNRNLLMQAVTGACLMTRRELYEELGGLDEKYSIGNFEDIDYCLKVKHRASMDVAYCPSAKLWHYASGSNNTATAEKNAGIFLEDWGDKVLNDDWCYY